MAGAGRVDRGVRPSVRRRRAVARARDDGGARGRAARLRVGERRVGDRRVAGARAGAVGTRARPRGDEHRVLRRLGGRERRWLAAGPDPALADYGPEPEATTAWNEPEPTATAWSEPEHNWDETIADPQLEPEPERLTTWVDAEADTEPPVDTWEPAILWDEPDTDAAPIDTVESSSRSSRRSAGDRSGTTRRSRRPPKRPRWRSRSTRRQPRGPGPRPRRNPNPTRDRIPTSITSSPARSGSWGTRSPSWRSAARAASSCGTPTSGGPSPTSLRPRTSRFEAYVDLHGGPGFGVLFHADVDTDGRMSGYSFDIDPVYEGGSYLVARVARRPRAVETDRARFPRTTRTRCTVSSRCASPSTTSGWSRR